MHLLFMACSFFREVLGVHMETAIHGSLCFQGTCSSAFLPEDLEGGEQSSVLFVPNKIMISSSKPTDESQLGI